MCTTLFIICTLTLIALYKKVIYIPVSYKLQTAFKFTKIHFIGLINLLANNNLNL